MTTDDLPIANDKQHRAVGFFFGSPVAKDEPQHEVFDDVADDREFMKANVGEGGDGEEEEGDNPSRSAG